MTRDQAWTLIHEARAGDLNEYQFIRLKLAIRVLASVDVSHLL